MKPRNTNCNHSQAAKSITSMLGKANPNQEAKFTTSGFSGKSLKREPKTLDSVAIDHDQSTLLILTVWDLLAHLSCKDEIGPGACECGGSTNASSVTHAQHHALTHPQHLLGFLPLFHWVLCRQAEAIHQHCAQTKTHTGNSYAMKAM